MKTPTRWNRTEIRNARQAPLKPILESLGYPLHHMKEGNYRILENSKDIVIKDHYWTCNAENIGGNSIDYLMRIEGMSFHKAMQLITS